MHIQNQSTLCFRKELADNTENTFPEYLFHLTEKSKSIKKQPQKIKQLMTSHSTQNSFPIRNLFNFSDQFIQLTSAENQRQTSPFRNTYEGTYDINVLITGRELTGISAFKPSRK